MKYESKINATKVLPFEMVVHNEAAGCIESEMYFEGKIYLEYDSEVGATVTTGLNAWLTGFAQYKDGKAFCKVEGLKKPYFEVLDISTMTEDEFETRCITAAMDRDYIKNLGK
jgi:hypothetical protein